MRRSSRLPSSRELLRRALRLAERGRATTAPNPRVGALLVRAGEVVGEGFHRRAGEPHAEALALAEAGERARGATLFVNLEPCCHFGRTPPCADALIRAGVARVVACHRDPDARVSGEGFSRLRAAGVAVEVGELVEEAVLLNLPYLAARGLGRVAVTLKWAMSLDGKIANASGESRWISGPAARRWALGLREEHDALLVGVGTVLADDPRLDRRLGLASGAHLRVVLDRRLRTPLEARLFSCPGPLRIYTEADPRGEAAMRLRERGADVRAIERVTPDVVLSDLAAEGVQSLLVEGGSEIAASFVAADRFDRVVAVVAPMLIGGATAPTPLGGPGLGALETLPRLERLAVRKRGGDLLIEGWNSRCLPELSSSVAG